MTEAVRHMQLAALLMMAQGMSNAAAGMATILSPGDADLRLMMLDVAEDALAIIKRIEREMGEKLKERGR